MVVAVSACGCSDDDALPAGDAGTGDGRVVVADAGADARGVAAPALPTLPAEPALPELGPCPSGWRSVALAAGVDVCEPWPEGGRAACALGSAHFAGTPDCVEVGGACPTGDWADDLPASAAIVYVRAGAAAGGTGSSAAPFATIGEAVAAASAGSIVAIAPGTYEETVSLEGGLTLWGTCAGETRIAGPPGVAGPVVTVRGAGNALRRVQVGGIDAAESGTTLALDGVVVAGALGGGVVARRGAAVVANSIRVTGTRDSPSPGVFGQGIRAESGGTVTATRVVLDDNQTAGAHADGAGSTITLNDAAITETLPRASDGYGGHGAFASHGGEITLARVAVEQNAETGLEAWGASSRLVASDCVSRSHVGNAAAYGGFGAWVGSGATLRLERCLVDDAAGNGVEAQDPATRLELADVAIARSHGQPRDGTFGRGVDVYTGAHVEIRRVLLLDNIDYGLGCFNTGTSIDAEDLTVLGTRTNGLEGSRGAALFLMCGGTVRRVMARDNQELGIDVNGTDASLVLEDITVTDTVPSPRDEWGYGMQVLLGARAQVRRYLSERNPTFGLYAETDGTELDASDVTIRDILPQVSDGWWGRGIHIQHYVRARLARVLIERSRETGIFADHSVLDLEDITIRDTMPRVAEDFGGRALNLQSTTTVTARRVLCERSRELGVALFGSEEWGGVTLAGEDVVFTDAVPGCGAARCSGVALGVYGPGAAATLTRFEIARGELAGVQIARGGEVDLHVGSVHHNLIGVNVQTDGFDLARVQDDVAYYANDANLQSRDLPVPSAF